MPHNGFTERFTTYLVPKYHRFALVSDANSGDFTGATCERDHFKQTSERFIPYFRSIMFDETGRCTVFTAGKQGKGRKLWLAGRMTARGRISVDAGAVSALAKGSSLLPAGATAIEGRFARGDVIEIAGPGGEVIARGLSEYDAADAARIIGLRSDGIADVLGYAPRSALVHRDQMVLL